MSTVELQASAASELYRAELALSDARDSGVAAWITAASNRLHEAVVRDAGARAALAAAA